MPDTYVKLPNGQYVQIPEGATPDQLQQMKSRLVQMQVSPESQAPDAIAQSRSQMEARVHQQPLISPGMEQAPITSPYREQQLNEMMKKAPQRLKDIRSAVLATAGAGLGSGAASAAAQGLPKFLQLMAGASGAGAGAGLGALAGGTPPKEALAEAAGTTATSMVLSPLTKWLASSKSVGAKALQAASQKAGNAPVELSATTNDAVDNFVQNEKLGGKASKGITDLLKRLGPSPGQAAEAVPGPLNYNEARNLYSNLGDEIFAGDLKGRAKQLAIQAWSSLGKDVQAGAEAAGAGPEHAIGMQEYAAASSRNRALSKGAKIVGIGGVGSIAAKALYEAGKMVGAKR